MLLGADDGPLDLSVSAPVALPAVLPATPPLYAVCQHDIIAVQEAIPSVSVPEDKEDKDPSNPELEKKTVRIHLRRVLRAGLATVGASAVTARKEVEKSEVDKWPSTMGARNPGVAQAWPLAGI